RFQTNGESHVRIDAELMDAVCKHISPLIPLGIVHRIAYDTYEREMERYGVETIETCERIFRIDSDHILELLPDFLATDGARKRWISAVMGIDAMLTAFGFSLETKLRMVDTWKEGFALEFDIDKS